MIAKKKLSRKPSRAPSRPRSRGLTATQILAREQARRLKELQRERDRAQRRTKSQQARVKAAARARTIASRERELRALKRRSEILRTRTRKLREKQRRDRELLRAQLKTLRELQRAGKYRPRKAASRRTPSSIRRTIKRIESSTFVPARPRRGTIQRQNVRTYRDLERYLLGVRNYAAQHPGEIWGVRIGVRMDGVIRLSDVVAPEDLTPDLIRALFEDVTDPNVRGTDYEEDEDEPEEDKLWTEVIWSPLD